MSRRAHPAQLRQDFHTSLLWLRSLEILVGHSPLLVMSELEMANLFAKYRSPWRA
jgi:hypothetical protein